MARKSLLHPGRGSTSIPSTPGLSRKSRLGGRSGGRPEAYIEIEDSDLDELAQNSIPCSSPYFTQPTQIVGRATQPTQIVNRTTLQVPSSPLVPSTPSTVIEVPASSPFQFKSQARSSPMLDNKPSVGSRVGSLMAPAGTSFRPPAIHKVSRRANGSTSKRAYLEISDDDLLDDYKKHDSSDDDAPARGDIRPSSFVKRDNMPPSSKLTSIWSPNRDISLNDIHEVRLRHLTSQVYKIIQRTIPEITIRACKEALQKDSGWQVSKAVDLLMGRRKTSSFLKATNASKFGTSGTSDGTNHAVDTKYSTTKFPTPVRTTGYSRTLGHAAPAQKSLHSFLHKAKSTANPTQSSSQTSTHFSSKSSSSSVQRKLKPINSQHRRLVQGRKVSQSPTVYPISSSSTSLITSPSSSTENPPVSSLATMAPTTTRSPSPEAAPRPSRRLIQGRRNKSPLPTLPPPTLSPPTLTILSDSESNSPPASSRVTRSRKRQMGIEGLPPPSKKQKLQVEPTISRKRKVESGSSDPLTSSDLTTPPHKKTKTETETELSSDNKSGSSTKRKADGELERQEIPSILEDEEDFAASPESQDEEFTNVLEYLNTCTVDALSRMIGSAADAKLMISARPFNSLQDTSKVFRQDKSRSKTKIRQVAIGESIVGKLASWLEACDAATAVINECDKRGTEIRSAMSTWAVDNNGVPMEDSDGFASLPVPSQPSLLSEGITLKDYQLVGLNWMNLIHSKGYSGILADDMGLGKTCEVISFIAHLIGSKREPGARKPYPNLIVVPPSTYENWLAEFSAFAPEIKVLAYSGKLRKRIEVEHAREHHVVLTTYPQVERQKDDLHWLQQIEPYAAIFDEGHRLKNRDTLIYKQMMRVPTEWRLVLSGTPVQNNLRELLTLLHFIEPSLFKEKSFDVLDTIFNTKVTNKDVLNFAALASERVDRARAVMAPFILQRRKEDVLDLPPKIDRLELVPMHATQKEIYDSIKGRYMLPNGVKKSKDAHPWMSLRKAAIHHQLFRHHFTDEKVDEMLDILWENCDESDLGVPIKEDRYKARLLEELRSKSDFQLHLWCKDEHLKGYIGHLDIPEGSWEESPKVAKLLELVRGYMKTGDRVLVFSRFEMVIDILRETFHQAGIKYCELTGNIDTSLRYPQCQKFTENLDIPVFILTTGAGGTGLNLTAANKIIIFDQSDNPQDDVQASNRAHRIGQTREVEVIRLITKNTVEGLIYNSCVKKLVLAARVEREFGVEDDEQESVEEECKRRMLLGDEIEVVEAAPLAEQT